MTAFLKQYYSASDLEMFWKKYFPVGEGAPPMENPYGESPVENPYGESLWRIRTAAVS